MAEESRSSEFTRVNADSGESSEMTLAERVFRLRLMESLVREVRFRASTRRCEVDESAIRDVILLNREIPMPESEGQGLELEIRAILGRCRSEVVRGVPWGNVAHHVRLAFRRSQGPYVPTLDELALV